MAIKVLMPKIGLTMAEGKIVEWRKKEGGKGPLGLGFQQATNTLDPGSRI